MLTVISLASNNVCSSLVDITYQSRINRVLIARCDVALILVPRFTHVIFLSGINTQVLSHPLHVLQPDVVILAQRITDPVLGEQDALEVRMIDVLDTEHVVDLALEPIRRCPDARYAFD